MSSASTPYHQQIEEELAKIPFEFLPSVLKVLQAFRETISLPSAEDSFKEAWSEAQLGMKRPVSELWDGIDGEQD